MSDDEIKKLFASKKGINNIYLNFSYDVYVRTLFYTCYKLKYKLNASPEFI